MATDALVVLGSAARVLWGVTDEVAGEMSGLLLAFAGVSAFGFAGQRLWRAGRSAPPPMRAEREGALIAAFYLLTGLMLTFGGLVLLVRDLSALNALVIGIGIFLASVGAATFRGSRRPK